MSFRNRPRNPPTPAQMAAGIDPEAISKAAASLWGKPLSQPLADAIGAEPHTAKVFTQFIEQFPLTAVITFAVTYGYMLRERVEKQKAAETLVRLT